MSKKFKRIIAVIWGVMGIVIIVSVTFPIWQYELDASNKYPTLVSSVVEEETTENTLESYDYTNASNWFLNGVERRDFSSSKVEHYSLSVPFLGIEDALVTMGGEDLTESLIQYPGTATPGKTGNTVVFGHSILPYFYDPTDYLSIFSTLPTIKEGKTIFVSYDGISYKYVVEDIFEVNPTDIEILEQKSGDSFITLVTCTPPGHPLKPKRLIVRARLAPIKQADANTRN
jgi:sortase A